MGLIVGCLRGVYHRLGPYFNRRIQVQPVSSFSNRDTTSTSSTNPVNISSQHPLTTPFCSNSISDYYNDELEQLEVEWNKLCNKQIVYKPRFTVYAGDTVYCCLIANWNDFIHVSIMKFNKMLTFLLSTGKAYD